MWVLSTIFEGLLIHFSMEPVQNSIPSSVTMSDEMRKVCDEEVENLLAKRAITEITDASPGFVCSFFCVSKRNGNWRPIVNSKPLNLFIRYEHFKMESLDSDRFPVREGDWLTKIDLK